MGKEKQEKKHNNNFFTESENVLSMRRLLAFIFTILAVTTSILIIVLQFSIPWQAIMALVGIPVLATVILCFCTSITDISTVIGAVKGEKARKLKDDINDATLDNKPDPNEL